MSWLESVRSRLTSYIYCSEVPTPESAESKRPEQEPIIFDELENPMLAELSKKHPLRPPPFEQLLQPLRMATMVEPLEGVKVDFGMGLSQRLQVSNSWHLAHGQGGNYEFTWIFVGGKMTNPYDMVSPNPFLMARFVPAEGRQDIKFIYKLSDDLDVKLTGNFMSYETKDSHVQLESEYTGSDFVAGAKGGLGMEFVAVNYIQSITQSLVTGLEMFVMNQPRKISLSYGAKYSTANTSYFAHYMAMQEMLTLGAVIKGNPNITFSTECMVNMMTAKADFTAGMSVRFQKAKFNMQLAGNGYLMASLQHAINPFARVSLMTGVDFIKQEQKFGMSINLGAS